MTQRQTKVSVGFLAERGQRSELVLCTSDRTDEAERYRENWQNPRAWNNAREEESGIEKSI
jgi:hypothetical protein